MALWIARVVFTLYLFALVIQGNQDQLKIDNTRKEGAKGSDVVLSVVSQIRDSCIFPNDHLFLRRVAYVESTDGMEAGTYRPAFHGGIWKITQSQYQTSLQCNNPILHTACTKIKQHFRIDWIHTTWRDLRKPLYSGLAAGLYLLKQTNGAEVSGDLHKQEKLWKDFYQTAATTKNYVAIAEQLSVECKGKSLDLVFLVDSSDSIREENFQRVKNFFKAIVNGLDISEKETRVGLVRFSTSASVMFYLNSYNDKATIIKSIDQVSFAGGSTNLASAINLAVQDIFDVKSGGRQSSEASRVIVLVTDGKSNYPQDTATAAQRAKDEKNITIFSLGVSDVDSKELSKISSQPVCTHKFYIKNFSEIDSLVYEIRKSSCETPKVIKPKITEVITKVIGINTTVVIDRIILVPDNMTKEHIITTVSKCAVVYIYAAFNTTNPSKAVYEFKGISYNGRPSLLFIKVRKDGKPLHVTIEIRHDLNTTQKICENGTVVLKILNKRQTGEIVCLDEGKIRNCTTIDIISSKWKKTLCPTDEFNRIKNPCSNDAIDKGNWIFSHPYDKKKFIQCDRSGRMYVTLCPPGLVFSKLIRKCESPKRSEKIRILQKSIFNPCTEAAIRNFQRFFPFPGSNSRFIHCDAWGEAWVAECQTDFIWYQDFKTCIPKDTIYHFTKPAVTIQNPCVPEELQKGNFFFLHPDPSKYIHCDTGGNYWVRSCPENMFFSLKYRNCLSSGHAH